jgi:hypothetical protein
MAHTRKRTTSWVAIFLLGVLVGIVLFSFVGNLKEGKIFTGNPNSTGEGCRGYINEFVGIDAVEYFAPLGGESPWYESNNGFYAKVFCKTDGKMTFVLLHVSEDRRSEDFSWIIQPNQPLVCADGPPRPQTWYRVDSKTGYEPYSYQNGVMIMDTSETGGFARYEGVDEDGYYVFQIQPGPSTHLYQYSAMNPGGILSCTEIVSPFGEN